MPFGCEKVEKGLTDFSNGESACGHGKKHGVGPTPEALDVNREGEGGP
jgi:hypothetical protein